MSRDGVGGKKDIILRDVKVWLITHHPHAAAIIVYYRQRTIQNTKRSIKQQEQRKSYLETEVCTKRRLRRKYTRFCHLCVHDTKACVHTANCAPCRTENTSITTVWYFPKTAKRVSTENKGRNEYKCTNERYFTPQTTDFKPFLIFFFLTYSTLELITAASTDWFEVIENILVDQWIKTSYHFKNALAGTHFKTQYWIHFTLHCTINFKQLYSIDKKKPAAQYETGPFHLVHWVFIPSECSLIYTYT